MEPTSSRVHNSKLKNLLVAAVKRNASWSSYVSQDYSNRKSKSDESLSDISESSQSKTISIKSPNLSEAQTKTQNIAEKRLSDEQLKHNADLKRRKKMCSPSELNEPCDIYSNSKFAFQKLECKSFEDQDYLKLQSHNTEDFCEIIEDDEEPCIASKEIVREDIVLVLPFLYPELQLNELLACRSVCHLWKHAVDNLLNTQTSMLPFNRDADLEIIRKLELGRIPICNNSFLNKLAKKYTFSNLEVLNNFTCKRKGKIVGSRVCLDNILLDDPIGVFEVSPLGFLATFDVEIRYLEIRHRIELPDIKIKQLMDRVKLCLWELPNLKQLKLVFVIDAAKIEDDDDWDTLQAMGKDVYESWDFRTFPKMEYLETLEFEVEILEGWSAKAKFLRNFCKSLIRPYCKQLKRLSVIAHSVGLFECLDVPSLLQLTIPKRFMCDKMKFGCKNVEKCTIITNNYRLKLNDVLLIQTVFPKLLYLGFKFEKASGEFHDFSWTNSTPTLPDVLTLELEDCGAVTFTILCCFPNLRYLKLKNKSTNKLVESRNDDLSLNVTKLCQGDHLYNSQLFWEHFPNVTLVTLKLGGEQGKNTQPTQCRWSRKGYISYWTNTIK